MMADVLQRDFGVATRWREERSRTTWENALFTAELLKAQGVSILLSEQNTHFAALVADRACVLEKGEVRFRGSMAELAANAEVRRQFLDL